MGYLNFFVQSSSWGRCCNSHYKYRENSSWWFCRFENQRTAWRGLLHNSHFNWTSSYLNPDYSLLLMQILPRLLNTGSLSVPAIWDFEQNKCEQIVFMAGSMEHEICQSIDFLNLSSQITANMRSWHWLNVISQEIGFSCSFVESYVD